MSYEVTIDICSNCKQHAWCTRHNEAAYAALAEELKKSIKENISDATVRVNLVGGQRMGSFEVACRGITLFSKLELGYFPHTALLTNRIKTFIEDAKEGSDLSKYKYSHSPIKHHPTIKKEYSKSPERTRITPNLKLQQESSSKNDSQLSEPKKSEKPIK